MRKLRYKRGTTEQKLKMDVEQIRKIIRKKSGEDFFDRGFLSDYVKRAPVDLQQELSGVFDVFYRLEYGNPGKEAVTEEDVKRARNIYNALRERKKPEDLHSIIVHHFLVFIHSLICKKIYLIVIVFVSFMLKSKAACNASFERVILIVQGFDL